MTSSPIDFEKLSVLVVDSQAHHRNLVAALLRGHGITKLRAAENAVEGLDVLRRFDLSVVLTEWESDGVDGLAFAHEVRRNDEVLNRAVPIIVVTARAARQDVEAARNAGVNEYVIRPVSAHSVISRLTEVILRPRPFIESPSYIGPCRRRRKTPNYGGPFRRMSDPIESAPQATQHDDARRKEQARRAVASIVAASHNLVPGDRAQLRRLHEAVQDMIACGQAIADPSFERAAQSLSRYLDGMGASSKLEPQVVTTHIEAMRRLVELPHAARDVREKVASGLALMVTKKLRGEVAASTLEDVLGGEPGPARGLS